MISGKSEHKQQYIARYKCLTSLGVGLVCIDGFNNGKTMEHESHGSDEVWWERNVTYYLEKKAEE
ncbi:MAG: hypothetical protein IJ091_09200 [Oscillospiraceae bacterium]|nr:hypothetical protein [Oscillospiraceae bacterium]